MDKSWIQHPTRVSPAYMKGIKDFIQLASCNTDRLNRTRCPCRQCKNLTFRPIKVVEDHLYKYGMYKYYTNWIWHGESYQMNIDDNDDPDANGDDIDTEYRNVDGIHEMLEDVQMGTYMPTEQQEDNTSHSLNLPEDASREGSFERLLKDAECELYPGCQKFSKLSFLLKLFHLKVVNRWSNKSFNMLLELLKEALPEGETLPKSHSKAKSLMRDLGLGYITIHACKNDCVLFWKENESIEHCPSCGESRYKIHGGKGKKIPNKVLRYFPLKPRLQRLFMSKNIASDMRWHKEKRAKETNVLSHPADSKAWEEFDKKHGWFAEDPRSVRLGLASDGFNPFGNMSNAYSMWPVILVPYNLPPWKCMKEPYMFMSLLIPGPKSPGNDIDVYLRPLIDELKELWMNGVNTYDALSGCHFNLHAAVIWTINDFSAYAMLSGWSTKGYLACPTCNEDSCSLHLKHGRKICYMGHRRFLPSNHMYRKRYKQFDGKKDDRLPPKQLTGDDIMHQLRRLTDVKFGKAPNKKKRSRNEVELNWSKKSIFFELPYWQSLMLRHNLDVMHIEKNICDNVLGTLMNIEGKTKDTFKSRLDLQAMGIRKELHLNPRSDKFEMPRARYTLSVDEKKDLCEWLKTVKMPDGYASNISRCVNGNDGKISGLKSHDSHILLQRLLPIVVRGYLDSDICNTLAELGLFFKELCCRKLKYDLLEALERDIIVILCKLEMIFPPSFFDVMVHLAVHLPREAMIAGPTQYRWMYSIERFLHTLKLYVRNKARPEGSIAEAYVDTECLTFCSMYLRGIETRFNREERNYDGGEGNMWTSISQLKQIIRPLGSGIYELWDIADIEKARLYVLNNCEEIDPYALEHKQELERKDSHNVLSRHAREFPRWLASRVKEMRYENPTTTSDDLYALACGPEFRVKRYSGCIVNGIRFHTRERERFRKTQNSGVLVKGEDMDYYGVLIDIIELRYPLDRRVFIFKCDWWDVNNTRTGIHKDAYFRSINVSCKCYKDEPFVLANQAKQAFYVKDNKLRGTWEVIQDITSRNSFDFAEVESEVENEDEAHTTAYQEFEPSIAERVIEVDLDMDSLPLNRDDIEVDTVDAEIIRRSDEDASIDDDDDTSIQYTSDEEADLHSDDTDLDDM